MKHAIITLALHILFAVPAMGADWYILCVKPKTVADTTCVKCSAMFRVFSPSKPGGGCTAIGMKPMVFATRQEALDWKGANCTCP